MSLYRLNPQLLLLGGTTSIFLASSLYHYWTQKEKKRIELEEQLEYEAKQYFRLPSNINVEVIETEEGIEGRIANFVKDLESSTLKIIGLDTEWKSVRGSSQPPLALLQLSTENECLLLRLCKMDIPEPIKNILEDENILKSGIAISNDARLIQLQFGVFTRGCVDVQPIAFKCGKIDKGSGLTSLSKSVLKIKVHKAHKIRCGDWEVNNLSRAQIEYGAIDAWVGRELLVKLYLSFNTKNETIYEYCSDVIDSVSKRAFSIKAAKTSDSNENNKQQIPKYTKVPKRKTDLYENCIMLDPNGVHLCSVNRKKVQWYVSRDLAVIVQTEPNMIMQLKHQPKGHGHANSEYYLAPKENRCVVCGTSETIVRFSIVPHSFRKLFPDYIKGHSSHDIVLLCQKCHRNASVSSQSLRLKLKKEFKMSNVKENRFEINKDLREVHYAGVTLTTQTNLPEQRKNELIKVLQNHFKKEEITDEDISESQKIVWKSKVEDIITLEETTVSHLKTREEQVEFVKRWRRHFVEKMKPKYLPTAWSIDHPVIIED